MTYMEITGIATVVVRVEKFGKMCAKIIFKKCKSYFYILMSVCVLCIFVKEIKKKFQQRILTSRFSISTSVSSVKGTNILFSYKKSLVEFQSNMF